MKLRSYQQEAVESVLEAWKTHRSVLVSMATGLGKTVVFSEIIRRLLSTPQLSTLNSQLSTLNSQLSTLNSQPPTINQQPPTINQQPTTNNHEPTRTMVLAHREELIRQGCETIHRLTGADVQMEMAEYHAQPMFGHEPEVVVSSIQTQISGGDGNERMRRFDPARFAAVVVDECHHATSPTYRQVLDWYKTNPECRVLGVTATPDRADEVGLRNVFEAVAFEYTIRDAIEDGWLVPVRQRFVKVESLDVSKVSITAGDFNKAELAEVLEDEANLHGIASPLLEICGTRGTIVFTASVKQAERLCEILNRGKAGRAAWLCGKTDKDERRRIVESFKSHEVQYLVNVGCLTEGFDADNVEVVAVARPTRSRALYAQMAGRGTRPCGEVAGKLGDLETAAERRALIAASSKPGCLVIDFVGASANCKLVSTADILAGKDLPPEVAERARKIAQAADGDVDAGEALEKAREEIEREKAAAAKRRAFITVAAKFISTEVDPFDLCDLPDTAGAAALAKSPLDLPGRLSVKQRDILRNRLKIDPDAHTYAENKALLDESFRRYGEGLFSIPQERTLRKYGICVPMTREEASRTLDRLFHHPTN